MKDFPRNPYRESAMAGIARCDNQIASYEDYVGSFYLKKGSYKAAIGRYETLLAAYPGAGVETDVLLKLGQAYKEIGESGKARDILSGLIARYPSSRQAEQARDILGSP
jgi:outer membrane protein assembly factor BamD